MTPASLPPNKAAFNNHNRKKKKPSPTLKQGANSASDKEGKGKWMITKYNSTLTHPHKKMLRRGVKKEREALSALQFPSLEKSPNARQERASSIN